MASKTYTEDFNDGPGGWVRVVDNFSPVAPLLIRDGAAWSYGPWWVDYNHAPPGGGYLQLLMCLYTRQATSDALREAGGVNRFAAGKFPTDFSHARITVRVRGELESAGAQVCLLVQGSGNGITAGWILTGQPIAVAPEYSESTIVVTPDPRQWTALGSRHDRTDTYGVLPLEQVLANVNVNLYLVLFPLHPRPMGPIAGEAHILRAGRDYPIWPSSVAQGYVAVDRINVEFK